VIGSLLGGTTDPVVSVGDSPAEFRNSKKAFAAKERKVRMEKM
jgi:hypothetical protein